MTYSLAAWEIDAAMTTLIVEALHRLAARRFVRRPCSSTARVLNVVRRVNRTITRITAVPVFYPHSINR